jgi:hypothetical protein
MAFLARYSSLARLDTHPGREAVFGYPAESPYNGQQLFFCEGATHPDPYHATNDSGVACTMTEGVSGGVTPSAGPAQGVSRRRPARR